MGLGTLDQSVGGSYLNPARAVPRSAGTGDQLKDGVRYPPGHVPGHANPGEYGGNGYMAADVPSNLYTVNAGIAYQALEKTKLTLNYYYIGTEAAVLANIENGQASPASSANELDFYLDQGIVDGLDLRIVGAYLMAGRGYTYLPNRLEDDAWEAGMRLQWSF